MYRVFIDGRILGYFGPGEYLKNLIKNLAHLDHENKYIVIINRKTSPPFSQGNFYFLKVPSFVRPYSPWEQLLLPCLIKRFKPDLAYFPNFNIPLIKLCPYAVTIHDLIYLLCPQDAPSYLSFCYARFMLRKAARLADIVITDSEYSRRDIMHYLKVRAGKVVNISGAAGDGFRPMDKTYARLKFKEKYGIGKNFILYIGNHHYHKNILTLIDAYSRLKARPLYNLVIAGKDGRRTRELEREVKKRNLGKDIIFPGFIPSEDLPLIYNAAACFAFPSLYEGFGLPPLEAVACGTPVIASNKGSLPEVLGDGAMLIDPLRKEELKEAMEKVLTSPSLRQELSEKGLKQAQSFSWLDTADKILGIFNKVSRRRAFRQ